MSDPDQPVVLTIVVNEFEAAMVVARLKGAGVNAHTEGALTSGFRAVAPGDVRVIVRHTDLERAQQILMNPKTEM